MSFTYNEYELDRLKEDLRIHKIALSILAEQGLMASHITAFPTKDEIDGRVKDSLHCAGSWRYKASQKKEEVNKVIEIKKGGGVKKMSDDDKHYRCSVCGGMKAKGLTYSGEGFLYGGCTCKGEA